MSCQAQDKECPHLSRRLLHDSGSSVVRLQCCSTTSSRRLRTASSRCSAACTSRAHFVRVYRAGFVHVCLAICIVLAALDALSTVQHQEPSCVPSTVKQEAFEWCVAPVPPATRIKTLARLLPTVPTSLRFVVAESGHAVDTHFTKPWRPSKLN